MVGACEKGRLGRVVRVVELSNHPGDMLADASRHRDAAGRRALAGYEDQLLQYRTWLQSLRVSRDRARAQRAWWTWLRLSARGR